MIEYAYRNTGSPYMWSWGRPNGWTIYGTPAATRQLDLPEKLTVYTLAQLNGTSWHAIWRRSVQQDWEFVVWVDPYLEATRHGLAATSWGEGRADVFMFGNRGFATPPAIPPSKLFHVATTDYGASWTSDWWPLPVDSFANGNVPPTAVSFAAGNIAVFYHSVTTSPYASAIRRVSYKSGSFSFSSYGSPCAGGPPPGNGFYDLGFHGAASRLYSGGDVVHFNLLVSCDSTMREYRRSLYNSSLTGYVDSGWSQEGGSISSVGLSYETVSGTVVSSM